MPQAKRICSWCGKDMGCTEADTYKEGAVTHGMCENCLEDMKRKHGQKKASEKTKNETKGGSCLGSP
jgi:hypothetical protein